MNSDEEEKYNLKESFEYILGNLYDTIRSVNGVSKDTWTENDVAIHDFFVKDFRNYLKNISSDVSKDFKVDRSQKHAKLLILPWYKLFFEDKDFYICYLFTYDLSEFFLTLTLKVKGKDINLIEREERNFKKLILENYKSNKNHNFEIIDEEKTINLKVKDSYEKVINIENHDDEKRRLKDNLGTAEGFEKGTLFAKKYEKNNLPSHEELNNDLINFLRFYKYIYDNKIFSQVDQYEFKRNIIYFGAPGTGKSFQLNEDKDILIKNENNFERVTFHPDYSYADFVGTYKPIPDKDDDGKDIISYNYVPGPFLRVLTNAIKKPSETFLLIIEEINRANVASVFGDIFQLLDRDDKYCSEYKINISEDMYRYFEKIKEKTDDDKEKENIERLLKNKKLFIPENMYIWATMNSADQGVFFMDTAFKRRWDFIYIDINNNEEKIENMEFQLNDGTSIIWNYLRKSINTFLLDMGINEDKCLGPFFISNIIKYKSESPDKDFIDSFKNKVLMYLYEDGGKSKRKELFEGSKNRGMFTYSNISKDFDNHGIKIFHEEIINKYNRYDEIIKHTDENE